MKKTLFWKALNSFLIACTFFQLNAQQSITLDTLYAPYAAVAAIDVKEPTNMVAGAATDAIFFSSDQGATWQASRIRPKPSLAGNATLLSDSKGNFYYFYLADSADAKRIVLQVSDDGGKTWETNDGIGLGLQQYAQLSAYVDIKNNLYLVWTQLKKNADGICTSNILLSKSTNKGKKWSDPIVLSQQAGDCEGSIKTLSGGAATIVGSDKIFAAWLNNGQVMMDRAYDGETWLNNDIVVTTLGDHSIDVAGFNTGNGQPMFISDNGKSSFGGSLYLVVTKKLNGDDLDVLFFRSHNGGDNWTSPIGFADDEPGTLQFKPAMTVDQESGHVFIVYYNQPRAGSELTDVYIAYSKDGGMSFKKRKINTRSFSPSKNEMTGAYISVAASKGVIVPVWTEMRNGKPRLQSMVFKTENFWKK